MWYTSSQSFLEGVSISGHATVTMFELYSMSLNWIATHTVSAIGNATLYPKNYVEIVFCILQVLPLWRVCTCVCVLQVCINVCAFFTCIHTTVHNGQTRRLTLRLSRAWERADDSGNDILQDVHGQDLDSDHGRRRADHQSSWGAVPPGDIHPVKRPRSG